MPKLLLISNSTLFGRAYLEHAAEHLQELYAGRTRILFIPFARSDHQDYSGKARAVFQQMGLELASLHEASDKHKAVLGAEGFFVGGGNTFRLLHVLQELGLLKPIRRAVLEGAPYAGASAGANLACPTIATTNDMPICWPTNWKALGLVGFQINPHYLDADPASRHMGETRAQRLAEYHEENATPVLGLREGAMLRVRDGQTWLLGSAAARLFRPDQEPVEIAPPARLAKLESGSTA